MIRPPQWDILQLAETSSTNTYALEKKMPHGTVVMTDRQTAGKGRHGKTWLSDTGDLKMSAVVELEAETPHLTSNLSLLVALAVAEAIEAIGQDEDIRLSLKWPNDIFLNGQKVAGILLEMDPVRTPKVMVIGIGVNVVSHPPKDEKMWYEATCLQSHISAEFDKQAVMTLILGRLNGLFEVLNREGIEAIQRLWKEKALGLGQRIKVKEHQKDAIIEHSGVFHDLAPAGHLRLALDNGTEMVISSGHVSVETDI